MNQSMFEGVRALMSPITVIVLGMLVLLFDLGPSNPQRRRLLYFWSIASLVVSALFSIAGIGMPNALPGITGLFYFGGGMVVDHTGSMFCIILCLAAALAIGMSDRFVVENNLEQGEYYSLILFSTAGAMLMALSYDLVNVFVGLEVLSVSLYILSGFLRRNKRSEESAVKYFLLGSFASGFLLYGTALIYGAVGIAQKTAGIEAAPGVSYTNFGIIHDTITTTMGGPGSLMASPLFIAGGALLIVGLAFKAAIVPFHSYAPDVYEGAPTPITAFMSAAAKIGAFAALLRLFSVILPTEGLATVSNFAPFHAVLWGLAAATVIVGNVLAIRQTNIKRMLAYSSIAHAGYILVGVLASTTSGVSEVARQIATSAVLYYLFTYTFMNLGAFSTVVWLGKHGRGTGEYTQIDDYAGLAKQQPLAAAILSLFMLSLAGIPPAAGFVAKLYIFTSAWNVGLQGLAVLSLVISVIGVFYYLRIIATMYFRPANKDFSEVRGGGARIVALVCGVATLLFGLIPAGVFAPTIPANQSGVAQAKPAHPAVRVARNTPPRP